MPLLGLRRVWRWCQRVVEDRSVVGLHAVAKMIGSKPSSWWLSCGEQNVFVLGSGDLFAEEDAKLLGAHAACVMTSLLVGECSFQYGDIVTTDKFDANIISGFCVRCSLPKKSPSLMWAT